MKLIGALLLLATAVFPQSKPASEVEEVRYFAASAEVTLTAGTAAFSIQAPAKAGRRVFLQSASIRCSAACAVSQERNGTAATATAVTAVALNSTATPTATFYTSSNSVGGTSLPPIDVEAGRAQGLDMSYSMFTRGADVVQNHSWRVTGYTGTFRVSLVWGEK